MKKPARPVGRAGFYQSCKAALLRRGKRLQGLCAPTRPIQRYFFPARPWQHFMAAWAEFPAHKMVLS